MGEAIMPGGHYPCNWVPEFLQLFPTLSRGMLRTVSVIVKICGITNLADALVVTEAGADAIGFVFWAGSPRRVGVEAAAEVSRGLPGSIVKVGVFVDAPPEE